ncbi:MAG: adenylate/guanylate cyclase domain-containing protein, partial [Spirochaetota bacterium]
DQLSVLLGDYAGILLAVDEQVSYLAAFLAWASNTLDGLWYVNAIDTVLMFAGMVSGAVIAFIYVVLLIRWTTGSIVGPVREILKGMERSAGGSFDDRTLVRERDEIGELSVGFNRMNEQLGDYFTRVSRLNEAYFQFVPERFLKILGRERIEDVRLGDQIQREMTLLFSDIRSFTSLTERMTPGESFRFINDYLGTMEPAITENEGFIDKYIGDAIMAIFDSVADRPINAALAMRRALREFNRTRAASGAFAVESGIGIHTGSLMLGLVGGANRMDGTVISDAVNLASRLEGLTKPLRCGILASDETTRRLGHESWRLRPLGMVAVVGRKDPIGVMEVLDDEDEGDRRKLAQLDPFAAALNAYRLGEHAEAAERFDAIVRESPADGPASYFATRARELAATPPEQWSGVETFVSK